VEILLAALLLPASPPPGACTAQSYLYQPSFCLDHELRGQPRPYHPQPGDIFLSTDYQFIFKMAHRVTFTGAPHHSGIVVARGDGRLALLESGPHNTLHVRMNDVEPHLASHVDRDRVWIRPRWVPLTCEQNRRLTAFAEAVDGRCFALGRLFSQATPFRHRGPVRTSCVGRPRAANFEADGTGKGVKRTFMCSELVAEACVAAGLLDPATTRPSATYPRDLFYGRSINHYIDRHLQMCEWEPPARWTPCPGAEPAIKYRPWIDADGPGPAARRGHRP
jgi:hypothetical protein